MKIIHIQNNLGTPKYKQIIQSVERAIEEGKLTRNEKLPSINKVCLSYNLSRYTVMQAYETLKKRGIVYAVLGKGYYVKSTGINIQQKIFLLFDELNIFKEDIYNSFLENIDKEVEVDIFFHHFNPEMFKKLIHDNNGHYTKYIIMPANLQDAATHIKTLPANEVYILDQTNPKLSNYPAIYQNFVKNIYDALMEGKEKIEKYKKLILIFPGFREPLGMKEGFLKFCEEQNMSHEVISEFNQRPIEEGDLFVIPSDRDLVSVIEQAVSQEFKLGRQYGIISYNETPLKKVVAKGITTISTDFKGMGEKLAKLISQNTKEQIENECNIIFRRSL